MLAIKNNLMAGNAARHLGRSYDDLATSVERLSSGLRINSAKDDAAGLAVRELIRADVAVLQQGSRNAQDGISLLQTMEGAMAVMDENLIRMMELAEQAATGSYSDAQRTIMNAEFAEMAAEIDRIAGATKFNDISLLNSNTGSVKIHVGTTETIDINKADMTQDGLGVETGNGEWSIMTSDDDAYANIDTAEVLNVAANALVLEFDFTDSVDNDDQEQIVVTFAVGDYTLEQVRDAINEEFQNPDKMYDADGNLLAYSPAEIVETDGANFKLMLTARDTNIDGMAITIDAGGGVATLTAGNIFGDAGTDDLEIVAAANDVFQKWDTATEDWIEDTTGGAGAGLNILTVAGAEAAITAVTAAINTKDQTRAAFGYKMNRLESTISIIDIQAENLMAAESRISDVDVSTEMAVLTRNQVLAQAGVAMLAQANAMPQMALTLLR